MRKQVTVLLMIILAANYASGKLPTTRVDDDETAYTSKSDYISGSDVVKDTDAMVELCFLTDKQYKDRFFFSINIAPIPYSEKLQENVPVAITFFPPRGNEITLKGNQSVIASHVLVQPYSFTSHSGDANFNNKTFKQKYQEVAKLITQYPIKSVKVGNKTYNFEMPPAGNPVLPNMKPSSTAFSIQGATLYDKYDNDYFSSSFTCSIFPEKSGVTRSELNKEPTFNNPTSTIEWQTCNLGAGDNPLNPGARVTLSEAKKRCPAGWRLPTLKDYRELFYDNHISYEVINGERVALFTYGGRVMAIPYGDDGLMLWTADSYPDYGMQGTANFVSNMGRYDQFTCDAAPADMAKIYVRYVRDKK